MLRKLITGGQTGVDRGALAAAMERGFPCGGWCPEGRMAEDGPLPDFYPLQELPGGTCADRTERNVRDSDTTLILAPGPLEGGTALTLECCERLRRPCLVLEVPSAFPIHDPQLANALARAIAHLQDTACKTLNVAGPRASEWPQGYPSARALVAGLLDQQGSQGNHRHHRKPL